MTRAVLADQALFLDLASSHVACRALHVHGWLARRTSDPVKLQTAAADGHLQWFTVESNETFRPSFGFGRRKFIPTVPSPSDFIENRSVRAKFVRGRRPRRWMIGRCRSALGDRPRSMDDDATDDLDLQMQTCCTGCDED